MSHHGHHEDDHHEDETVDRRAFMRSASLGLIGAMVGGFGLPGIAIGQTAGVRRKTLVKIFMRGGADGIHLFPPYADAAYYRVRPVVNIKPPSSTDATSAIRLTDRFGMNPNLAPLMEIWNAGRMAISMATHLPEGNRSHFFCQRFMEEGRTDSTDGIYNRYLQSQNASHPFSGLAAGTTSRPSSLAGPVEVPSVPTAAGYQLSNADLCSGTGCSDNRLTADLLKIVARNASGRSTSAENLTRASQRAMLQATTIVAQAAGSYVGNTGNLSYSGSPLGNGLKLIAQLLKASVPVQVATVDWSNAWDTHENMLKVGESPVDPANKYQAGIAQGARDLVAFYRDLGPLIDDVCVLVGSEFGRTVKQNGSLGLDHGSGGAWFAFGGTTRGGIYGQYGSLDPVDRQLYLDQFLPTVVNYKDFISEAMVKHMGMSESLIARIFPGHTFTNNQIFSRTPAV